jgi:RNA polymerase sigma factor (sigma-70 family)
MNADIAVESKPLTDASLVDLSLSGDREAFGEIVTRYQGPICAMAYSSCGSISRSEDIAQEVFIAAWRKLTTLQEPARFKAWLYGIARNLIRNAFRQHCRNPVGAAELLESAEPASATDSPEQEAITREEETLLWNVLSGLPAAYREPMVLFYRHNESVAAVADALGITQEAVRQRLSRGRAMLNERLDRMIQTGLRRSGPSNAFRVMVIAALPVLASSATAKGAVVGIAVTKGTTAQAGGLASFLKALGVFGALVGVPAALGSYFGQKLGNDALGGPRQRRDAARFWRVFGLGIVLLVFAPFLLLFAIAPFIEGETRTQVFRVLTTWVGLAYPFVIGSVAYWLIRRRRQRAMPVSERDEADACTASSRLTTRPRALAWAATAAAAGLLIFCFVDMNHDVVRPSAEELQRIVREARPSEVKASVLVTHLRSMWGSSDATQRSLWLEVGPKGHTVKYAASVNDTVLALLQQKGIACPTYVAGRDFEILGAPGRFLPVLAGFVLGIGGIYLLKRRGGEKAEVEIR